MVCFMLLSMSSADNFDASCSRGKEIWFMYILVRRCFIVLLKKWTLEGISSYYLRNEHWKIVWIMLLLLHFCDSLLWYAFWWVLYLFFKWLYVIDFWWKLFVCFFPQTVTLRSFAAWCACCLSLLCTLDLCRYLMFTSCLYVAVLD